MAAEITVTVESVTGERIELGCNSPDDAERLLKACRGTHSFMFHLRRIAARTDDVLLVYYAGHGVRHDTRDMLYLTTGRTDPDALNESAVAAGVTWYVSCRLDRPVGEWPWRSGCCSSSA